MASPASQDRWLDKPVALVEVLEKACVHHIVLLGTAALLER
jgi:hypothetical protein